MKKLGIALFIILLLSVISFMLLEHDHYGGKLLAESRNTSIPGEPSIKVREFKSSFLDDNPPYRFEYYCYDYPEMWSSQTFVGKSFTANSAQIEWSPDGIATVSLDHCPTFTCKDGVWENAVKK
jgi:hypothetical protein